MSTRLKINAICLLLFIAIPSFASDKEAPIEIKISTGKKFLSAHGNALIESANKELGASFDIRYVLQWSFGELTGNIAMVQDGTQNSGGYSCDFFVFDNAERPELTPMAGEPECKLTGKPKITRANGTYLVTTKISVKFPPTGTWSSDDFQLFFDREKKSFCAIGTSALGDYRCPEKASLSHENAGENKSEK